MFQTQTIVKLHHTDAAGIVFFANYYPIAHSAYEAFMKSIGLGIDWIIQASDYIILVAHSEADYEKPLFHGEKVTIALKAEAVGNSSFVLSYTFRNQKDYVVARVKTAHVVVSKKTGKKQDLPDKLKQGLAGIS